MSYRWRGMGDGSVMTVPSFSVASPLTPAQQSAALTQAQTDYSARAARCKTFQTEEFGLIAVAGIAAFVLLSGGWKLVGLAALPAALMAALGASPFPRSADCDYGL